MWVQDVDQPQCGYRQGVVAECAGFEATDPDQGVVDAVIGLRWCSGFEIRRDGNPPCETIVGGCEATGRGTKA